MSPIGYCSEKDGTYLGTVLFFGIVVFVLLNFEFLTETTQLEVGPGIHLRLNRKFSLVWFSLVIEL